MSELDSVSSYEKSGFEENLLGNDSMAGRQTKSKKKGCMKNFANMCWDKQVVSQEQLYADYMAEVSESSRTSIMDD